MDDMALIQNCIQMTKELGNHAGERHLRPPPTENWDVNGNSKNRKCNEQECQSATFVNESLNRSNWKMKRRFGWQIKEAKVLW